MELGDFDLPNGDEMDATGKSFGITFGVVGYRAVIGVVGYHNVT